MLRRQCLGQLLEVMVEPRSLLTRHLPEVLLARPLRPLARSLG